MRAITEQGVGDTILISAIALMLVATTSQAAAEPSFCQRMAAKLPMTEKRVAGARRAFDMQTMNAAQRLLLGGSTHFSMRLEPIDNTPAEAERLAAMCTMSPCTMEGSLRFTLGLKDGTSHSFEALPGERMRIEMKGTRIRCSDI